MTYWIVIAMLGCSLVAVLAAFAAEADDPDAVPPAPDPPPSRGLIWAAMGASDGTGDGTPNPVRDNWISQVTATLQPDVAVLNLSVSGSTLEEARQGQLPAVLAAAPDVVSLWLAINDIVRGVPLDTYETQLAATLRTLTAAECRVVVGNVLDVAHLPVVASDPELVASAQAVVPLWNAAIARVATAHGVELVDLYAESSELAAHPEYVGPDGFHPSPAGHARLAARFRPAITRALNAARAELKRAA